MAGNPGGFKLPVSSSSYHEKCIAASVKAYQASANAPASDKNFTMIDYRNCNQVSQNKIWSENVYKEYSAAKRWKMNWGFMTESDQRGRPREKKDAPKERSKHYTERIPSTSSRQYGHKLESPNGKKIYQFERLTSYHKRKSGLEDNYR